MSRRVCFAIFPGTQIINHSFPILHFLIGLKQLTSLYVKNGSPQLKFELKETKDWVTLPTSKQ